MSTILPAPTQTGRPFECLVACDALRAVPERRNEDWLHSRERVELARLRNPARREVWLFGRWVAKRLVRQALSPFFIELSQICIASRNERGESVRPTVAVHGELKPWSLSLSHTDDVVAGYLETTEGLTIGIDVMPRNELGRGFARTWFTPNEQAWAQESGNDGACLVWAAKEAVYKAVNDGVQSFAPRQIEILPDESGALIASYCGNELRCFIESRIVADHMIVVAKLVDRTISGQ